MFSTHYKRLQEIEQVGVKAGSRSATGCIAMAGDVAVLAPLQKVVHAIQAASFVMDELSDTREGLDKERLHMSASVFVQQIKVGNKTSCRGAQHAGNCSELKELD